MTVELQRPKRLQPGMTIGVIAPSSGIRDERMEMGISALEGRGYRVVRGDHLYDQYGFVAGTDEGRAADMTGMFARDDVDAVFCGRGGYGACRMVDLVDWDIVRAHPKVFVGYSDVTTLHAAMECRGGMISFHGPMVVTLGGDLSAVASECFWRMIERAEPAGLYDTSDGKVRALVPGKACGALVGGCLTLMANTIGSVDQLDLDGRIVAIEDVNEEVYRIDRMLTQMLRAGMLQRAAGFLIGTSTGAPGPDAESREPIDLEDVWHDRIAPLGKPTIVGFPFGHEPNPLMLPLGAKVELNADLGEVRVLEAAVA